MTTLPIETTAGVFHASFSEKGLAQVAFPTRQSRAGAGARTAGKGGEPLRAWERDTRRALVNLVRGRAPTALPPFDLAEGTDFQRRVWRALSSIPFGQTRSYAEIARDIGCPGAARAVGQACGANPIPLLIPCHRVLAANRKLGGFSGGLDWKKRLLALEGVRCG